MQLTSQKAGTTSPYTNRMDLTYSYSASSGQMGIGSTAGNARQLMSISGTINSTTESASYTYDNYFRLVTSNQTSNSSSAQRRFAYDRWGNRTGVWNATSGGTQIQSISYPTAGSAPTNRISSVTNNGSTVNYSYDAAGNVTNDGVHTYTYDSESRVVSVDSGSTATYAYDHQNRRYKKTVGSAVTHYVWEGGQVIAEHNGSTGAVLVDYIKTADRMIAKVESSTTSYFLNDRLSVRITLNTSGNMLGRQAHLPFGEDFGETGTQEKHHFTSYERDVESGTDYAWNRQYSQSVGRFMSADPYKASGYLTDPQSWNRYSYTRNDPVNRVDLRGLEDDVIRLSVTAPFWSPNEEAIRPGVVGAGGRYHVRRFTEGELRLGEDGGGDPEPQSEIDPYKPDGNDDCADFVLYLIRIMREFRDKKGGASRLAAAFELTATSYGKKDSTTGFIGDLYGRDEKNKDRQGGDMYKHIVAFAGLQLLINLGGVAGTAAQTTLNDLLAYDAAQQAQGRRESIAEVKDDYAGMAVGNMLTQGLNGSLSDVDVAKGLMKELCDK
jgi:RHS repeat-associated protein